jgi:ribose transport system permease protein
MSENNQKFWSKINFFNKNSMAPSLLLIYALMIVIFSSINPLFVTVSNFKSILSNMGIFGIMAVGLSLVMITGNFDMSVGSILGISAVVAAKLFNIPGVVIPIPVVILISIATGALVGALNGFIVTYIGINSVITTLGTLAIIRGLAFVYATEPSLINNEAFIKIGRGYIFKIIPQSFIYMIVILFLMYLVLRFTKFGRDIYQAGSNQNAARLAGVNVKRTQFLAFIASGVAASIGGIIMASQLAFAQGEFGLGAEFSVLTICVLGGISLVGGRGTLVSVLVSIFILGSISNGLALIRVPVEWRDAFQGIILIAAILIDSIRMRKRELLKA